MDTMPKRILVVDDSEAIRDIIKLTLQFKGYEVTDANDGREAYDILSHSSYDLVITDLEMPRMSGYELIDRIRNDLRDAKLPIIVCSAELNVGKQQLLDKGANAFLRKPISPFELLDIVALLLK